MNVTIEQIAGWVNKLTQQDTDLGDAAHRRDIAATYLVISADLGGEDWYHTVIDKHDPSDWRSAISTDLDEFIEVVYIEPMLRIVYGAPV